VQRLAPGDRVSFSKDSSTAQGPSPSIVVNCSQLLTLTGPSRARTGVELLDLGIHNDAAMMIIDGRIAAIDTYAEIKALAPVDARIINAQGRTVMPGFVDAHTHLLFGGNRLGDFEQRIAGQTYQEIATAGGGIASTLGNTRKASEEDLVLIGQRHAEWFLRGGTTTIEAKSGYGLSLESELKLLRAVRSLQKCVPLAIVPTLLAAHTVPPEFRADREAYIALIIEEIIPTVCEEKLASYCDIFCDDHAFTVAEARPLLQHAKRQGLELRMHVEQFRSDGGAKLAAELGAATADHLECMCVDDMPALKAAGVQPVLLPASVFALGRTEYPNARAMIEAGLAPVIATDFNPGSSPTASMPFIITLAALYMKMLPAESVVASTINAAASLNLAHEIGSLEVGKRADFIIHEFSDYRELGYFIAAPSRPRVFVSGQEVL
jgi:imidazolonepropionase